MLFSSTSNLQQALRAICIGALLGFLFGGSAKAQLVATSPFLPAESTNSPDGTLGNAALELRGIMTTSTEARFCIYDPAKRACVWSGLNEGGYSFVIKSADLPHDSITVQTEGRTLRLVLQRTQDTMPALVGPPAVAASPAESVAAPTAAEQAKQIGDAAEAVRLRRVLREEAALRQGAAQPQYPPDVPRNDQTGGGPS